MMQPDLTLYHFPGACSRVAVCALEMAGLDYTLELVNLRSGEQTGAEYQAVSPLGKVPMLVADSQTLAENAAIITFIAGLRPGSGVFPKEPSPWRLAEVIGGLSFCAGTLHPQVRGLMNPARLTTGETAGVRERSVELFEKSCKYAENRLAARGWWVDEFTIVDVYLDWALSVGRDNGFDLSRFPAVNGLRDRLADVPAYARMQEGEARNRAMLGL